MYLVIVSNLLFEYLDLFLILKKDYGTPLLPQQNLSVSKLLYSVYLYLI